MFFRSDLSTDDGSEFAGDEFETLTSYIPDQRDLYEHLYEPVYSEVDTDSTMGEMVLYKPLSYFSYKIAIDWCLLHI